MRIKNVADAQTGSETVLIVNKYNPDNPDYGGFDVVTPYIRRRPGTRQS